MTGFIGLMTGFYRTIIGFIGLMTDFIEKQSA